MKNSKYLFLIITFSVFFSCTDLDTKINNEWTDEDAWTNAEMAEGILISVYDNIQTFPDAWDGNFLDAATDNALTRSYSSNVFRMSMGAYSNTSNPMGIWNNCYDMFQKINMFLERGLGDGISYDVETPDADIAIKKRLEGEAYFLRAYVGFMMLQMYGGKTDSGEVLGYPIVTRYYGPDETADASAFPRNTYPECVAQIIRDCETAMEILPFTFSGGDAITGDLYYGRGAGLAAAVLKVKTLLYAASPAYQPDSIVRINSMGDFTVVDPVAYKSGWERAATYAAEVMAMPNMGTFYALTASDLADANHISLSSTAAAKEFVFFSYLGKNNDLEKRHYPPFYYGKAQTIPSQNFVDAFSAKNGFPITDARSGYDSANPYAIERDKRFALNVFYHGSQFGANPSMIDVVPGGKDSGEYSEKASRSGYYLAKYLNTNTVDMLKPLENQTSSHYYPLLRRADLWLSFAEAANEAWGPKALGPGCSKSAYDVIKTIRSVSGGITDVTYLNEMANSVDNFRTLILNERRIELAFENHRFWDLRRRLLPLDENIYGMSVTRNEEGVESFEVKEIEQRPLSDIKYYYMPMPYDEMQKTTVLINNMGWSK